MAFSGGSKKETTGYVAFIKTRDGIGEYNGTTYSVCLVQTPEEVTEKDRDKQKGIFYSFGFKEPKVGGRMIERGDFVKLKYTTKTKTTDSGKVNEYRNADPDSLDRDPETSIKVDQPRQQSNSSSSSSQVAPQTTGYSQVSFAPVPGIDIWKECLSIGKDLTKFLLEQAITNPKDVTGFKSLLSTKKAPELAAQVIKLAKELYKEAKDLPDVEIKEEVQSAVEVGGANPEED